MASPHEKDPFNWKDWITYINILIFLSLSSGILWLIWQQRNVKRLANREITRRQSPKHISDDDRPFRCLNEIKPWDLITATAGVWYLSLVSETVSWTYGLIVKQWDWFVIINDGITILIETLAIVLLIITFIQRSFVVFSGTYYLRSTTVFGALFFGAFLNGISGIMLAVFTIGLQWILVSYMSICVALSLLLTTIFSTYILTQPLLDIAKQSRGRQFLDVCGRLTLLTGISATITTFYHSMWAISSALCEECTATFVYYNVFPPCVFINLCVLYFSINGEAYFKYMKTVHEWTVWMLLIGENKEVWDKTESTLGMNSRVVSNETS